MNEYLSTIQANDEVKSWFEGAGKKAIKQKLSTEAEMEHILDYLVSSAAPTRLRRMAFKDAKRKAQEWSEANQKKGRDLIDMDNDVETIMVFEDGSFIVKLLTENAYKREGFFMSHCLGGYSVSNGVDIYSYRDEQNTPHATFEVRSSSNEIIQVKGKGNGEIHPKYIHPVLDFLEYLGMKVRPSEMKNIGYYHIDKSHIKFLKKIPGAWKQVAEINGEYYAF